jgi:hypothetical protein
LQHACHEKNRDDPEIYFPQDALDLCEVGLDVFYIFIEAKLSTTVDVADAAGEVSSTH